MSGYDRAPLSRSRGGGGRFYNNPPRWYRQQQQQQQRQRRKQRPSISISSMENGTDHEEHATSYSPPVNNGDNNSSQRNSYNPTNLDRFLEYTTPVVRTRHFPKITRRAPRNRTIEIEHPPHFVLKDLWDSFEEWSAMGIGIPLTLYETDSVTQYPVTQYYVPYLSAIQLYMDPSTPSTQRTPSDELDTRNPLGQLVFEYFEHEQPSNRGPLFGKISNLAASQCPALMTYRSCDLSPSSWISVAWYPIYMIPDGLQKVDTCFLTYHCLSTQGTGTNGFNVRDFLRFEMSSKLSLHTFGLAFYKFRGPLWITAEVIKSPKVDSLLQEAKNWVRRLQVLHPDFMFFESHT